MNLNDKFANDADAFLDGLEGMVRGLNDIAYGKLNVALPDLPHAPVSPASAIAARNALYLKRLRAWVFGLGPYTPPDPPTRSE